MGTAMAFMSKYIVEVLEEAPEKVMCSHVYKLHPLLNTYLPEQERSPAEPISYGEQNVLHIFSQIRFA